MILNVLIHEELRYAETWSEMSALIDEVMETLKAESCGAYRDPGEDAKFMFSDRRHTGVANDWPKVFLHVAVNRSTGYGGLIWFVDDEYPIKGGIFDHVWLSDNPTPPDSDPRVIADPGGPSFHDPRSTLPLPRVRQALEEFCRAGTGERPECISWVRGNLNGRRIDALYYGSRH